jgi:hypothetical protein
MAGSVKATKIESNGGNESGSSKKRSAPDSASDESKQKKQKSRAFFASAYDLSLMHA